MSATHPSPDPALPPPVPAAVLHAPAKATPLASAILGFTLLRLGAQWRPKTVLRFAAVAVGLILLTRFGTHRGNQAEFLEWVVDIYAFKILPLFALVLGGAALRGEIRDHTIEYLVTRPIRRSDLVISAYVTTAGLVLIQAVIFTFVICATAATLAIPDVWSVLPRLLLAEVGIVATFSAIGLALGLVTGKYLVLGVVYGLIVELGLSRLPTAIRQIAVTTHAQIIVERSSTGFATLTALLACAVIAAVAVGLAVLLHSSRPCSEKSGD